MRLRLKQRYRKMMLFFIKLFRQEGSPECIARGAALGLLAAFLVPIGTHTIMILLLGFIFRCNKITAMGVTFTVSNEITIPIIYPLQCIMGSYIINDPLSLIEVRELLSELYNDFNWTTFCNLGREIGIPFVIGGAILSVLTMPFGYIAALKVARNFKARHEEKVRRRKELAAAASAAVAAAVVTAVPEAKD